nr:hypothetical protein [uncultured Methanobacterium sp.]
MAKDKNKTWWSNLGAGKQFLIIFCVTILFFLLVAMTAFKMAPNDTSVNSTPVVKKNVTEEEYVVLVQNATSAAEANSALVSMTATEYLQGMVTQSEAVKSIDKYYGEVYHAYNMMNGVNPPEKYMESHKSLTRNLLILANDIFFIRNDVSMGITKDIQDELKRLAEDEDTVVKEGNWIQ